METSGGRVGGPLGWAGPSIGQDGCWILIRTKEGCMSAEIRDSDPRPPTRCVRLRKVLIVDKDPFWGPAIRLALEESGYYLNLVTDAQEGCRRALERAYDLGIVSASLGQGALQGMLEQMSRRVTPP